VLTLGGAVVGGVLLEWASLGGAFDNTRRQVFANVDVFHKSMAALDADAALQAGSILHIGHSMHLITVAGVRVLTDPWLYDPALGSLRHEKGIPPSPWELGVADVICVTHEHPDHADPGALARLPRATRCLVGSERTLEIAKAAGLANVTLMQSWQSVRVRELEITAVPAPHDVAELGFVFRGADKSVYYAGDASEGPALAEIRTRLAPKTAILPVDGMHRKGAPRMTMGPEQAVEAARTLGVAQVMPSHAETRIADPVARAFLWEKTDDAANVFFALTKERLPGVTCFMPAPGEIVAL
jgi:L-ascorbate metabolism protein UlaG (beta-lactamase superfamily)